MIDAKDLEEFSKQISDELNIKRRSYPKTVIFCRNYTDCSNIYAHMVHYIDTNKTEPPGYPNLVKYRMFTMYTRASTPAMKSKMMSAFCNDTNLHVVIATCAFSMGIDCRNIQQVIHWGALGDLEQYVQEIGRAGRDGSKSKAVLMYSMEDQINILNKL